MNKKANTVLFIIAATVINVIVTMVCFMILLISYSHFLFSILPDGSLAWALPLIFVVSIIVAFFVYRVLIRFFTKKVDVEKYFDPIFNRLRR